ncbi:hypothetical protein DEAC_c30560 [Desulfosporosinus acididurans]|uniref:Uncharacterized protein n=1 Tax=Desulfosporosinus acididurans TaxID=476652 RepID=A0A0J1FNM2_9FIRM|nr:hypothetical protein DEAC_c30560 [Desulfosporosinus acididurans]
MLLTTNNFDDNIRLLVSVLQGGILDGHTTE